MYCYKFNTKAVSSLKFRKLLLSKRINSYFLIPERSQVGHLVYLCVKVGEFVNYIQALIGKRFQCS